MKDNPTQFAPARPEQKTAIAHLFDNWQALAEAMRAGSATEDQRATVNLSSNAIEDEILMLPAADALDVWRKVVVVGACEDPDPGTLAGKLLQQARSALGIAA
jgi:hypothetical protein